MLHCHGQGILLPGSCVLHSAGVIQAPLSWGRGRTESCHYTSRSELLMWHWHKQLQSYSNLHEIGLLPFPKKRKMQRGIQSPFPVPDLRTITNQLGSPPSQGVLLTYLDSADSVNGEVLLAEVSCELALTQRLFVRGLSFKTSY